MDKMDYLSGLLRRSWIISALIVSSLCCIATSTTVLHDGRTLIIDGQRRILISGAIHYPRSTPEMWPDLIKKAKEGGIDVIETYVFWNGHEPRRGEYHFEGNFDIIRFLDEVKNAGLYAVLRIGPYVCAEWNYGGIPGWIKKTPGMVIRTNNEHWKVEMQNFTTLIVNMVKQANMLAPQGGPIILTQIENEYGNGGIEDRYGEAGKEYVKWCGSMAISQDIGVPWIMCQQPDAPKQMINTCNGFQCAADFRPNNRTSPKIWTENWTGWFKKWGQATPFRTAENVAYEVARFFQRRGSMQNYYMYHGGTNFGRMSGGPYISTTYDYDAPLDEYGNVRQPKWGHLKELHASIKMMERALTRGIVFETPRGNGVTFTKFWDNGKTPSCFLSNDNVSSDATVEFEGKKYFLPAYSVSILPDCKKEVFNTAKIKTQTSVMVKKTNGAEDQPKTLKWSWYPENLKPSAKSIGSPYATKKLLEQITFTADESDYLWYMTSVNFGKKQNMTLSVNTTGHLLYAFVNGRLVGSQYGTPSKLSFVFEKSVMVKRGRNQIQLLSATVGLPNYGAFYDQAPAGIVDGPVKLTGEGSTVDLSKREWTHKTGLDGEVRQIWNDHKVKWRSEDISINRPFTWYKTTFLTPLGSEPVVVDLSGLNKGMAWVNGNNIGRYWVNATAPTGDCKGCYVGPYTQDKICYHECGVPSQRWYHVPRSFMRDDKPNTLILFEEAGGFPTQVNFKTVVVGKVCAKVPEGGTMNLACQDGQTISKIDFASFGNPQGNCGAFRTGDCDTDKALEAVKSACLGKESCSIAVRQEILGKAINKMSSSSMTLAVQLTCYEEVNPIERLVV